MAITDRGINARPAAVDQWLRESLGRGGGVFEARITPTGGRLFYFRYSANNGARVRLQVGTYSKDGTGGGLTLKDARDRAAEWSLMYRAGVHDLREHFDRERLAKDAAAQQEVERREADRLAADLAASRRLTVRQVFERWAATELTPRVRTDGKRDGRKDGGAYVREQFKRRIFNKVGDVPIGDVRRADLLSILDAVKAEGKLRTANVLLAELKQMCAFALKRELIERNPLDTVTKRDVGGAETTRARVLTTDEIKALHKAMTTATMGPRTVLAVWLILATGARVSEATGARWADVDIDARTWHLSETKNERDHTIHLSAFALRQFEGLRALQINDAEGHPTPWVFPNRSVDRPVDIKTFGKQLADRQRVPAKRMQHRSKETTALVLPGGRWTSHDLRRTAATIMAELGVSGDVIDECLNHVIESRVRRTYIRDRRLTEQARAFDALGARLEALTVAGRAPDIPE